MAGLSYELRDRSDNLLATATRHDSLRALLRFLSAQSVSPETYVVVERDREGMLTRLDPREC
jgi:hypothetical protein